MIREEIEQPFTQIETSVRASRALVLNGSLSGLASVGDGDGRSTERVGVRASTGVELVRVESDGVLGVGVVDSTGTESDWEEREGKGGGEERRTRSARKCFALESD